MSKGADSDRLHARTIAGSLRDDVGESPVNLFAQLQFNHLSYSSSSQMTRQWHAIVLDMPTQNGEAG